MNVIAVVLVFIVGSPILVGGQSCRSPQYLEIRTTGTVLCSFEEGFSSIHWYYDADLRVDDPVINYRDGENEGPGYNSGEFQIEADGSLKVNNVSMKHETKFTVVEFRSVQEEPNEYEIDVITTIRPRVTHPTVEDCTVSTGGVCYIESSLEKPLVCRIEQARPAIRLKWLARALEEDILLTNKTLKSSQSNTWTTSLALDNPFEYSSYLALLICKAEDDLNLLDRSDTIAFVKYQRIPRQKATVVAVELNDNVELACIGGDFQLLVWEMLNSNDSSRSEIISYDIANSDDRFVATNDFRLNEGNLMIAAVKIQHEGLYRCIRSGTAGDHINEVNVNVYVNPVPSYPVIDGCNHEKYCVLEVSYHGNLRCTVKGIRPEVHLEWKTFHQEKQELITFHNQQLHTKANDDETYDVVLTTDFIVKDTTDERITLECRARELEAINFDLQTKFDLLLSGREQTSTTSADTINDNSGQITTKLIIIVVIVAFIVVGVTGAIFLYCRAWKKKNKKPYSSEEESEKVPLKQTNTAHLPPLDDRDVFMNQLRSAYENFYSGVKPIPFLAGNFTVQELFVEGDIEYMTKSKRMTEKWEPFSSYQDIFTDPRMTGNRWIIEGEPGYGKSTLSLQLAYEWCKQIKDSCMCGVDLFILIRLRQLKGVTSFYEAIRQFLLPIDSKFTEEDVRKFIDNNSSVLIILDGFDEYPNKESYSSSDVFHIVKRNMLSDCRVILTTRSSQLPEEFAGQTNRLRLRGFRSHSQDQYLEKAVAINGHSSVGEIIKEWLEENPILSDLCEVPLFFAMYAHLSVESDYLKKCTSVTSFFRFMITCLHHHLKLKFKDENVEVVNFDVDNHETFDKLCYDMLNGHSYNPDFDKNDLLRALGERVLEEYLSIGVLREDKTTIFSKKPSAAEQVKIVCKVRFYHSLFCEWFAAHYVAKVLDESNEEQRQAVLEDLDPNHHQYVYRFASGIKTNAAKHILTYLKPGDENAKFCVLCIVEQAENIDDILEKVRDVCSETVQIRYHDSKIMQRSVIQLLEIAISKEIQIPKLQLIECFKSVDESSNEIVLSSEVRLPILSGVEMLMLEQPGTEFSEKEFLDIITYISMCKQLREIRFSYSLLPLCCNDHNVLEFVRTNQIKVLWYPSELWYSLDWQSGTWQHKMGSSPLTTEGYNKVVQIFREIHN